MESLLKYGSGVVMSCLSFFAPIQSLIICAVVFIAIDFVTGIMASRKRALRRNQLWGFESGKAWNTVTKLAFVMAGIILAWLIDTQILDFMNLRLANTFTGFVCGVEFWSYLENAAEISQHPIFRWLGRFMKTKLDRELESDTRSERFRGDVISSKTQKEDKNEQGAEKQ